MDIKEKIKNDIKDLQEDAVINPVNDSVQLNYSTYNHFIDDVLNLLETNLLNDDLAKYQQIYYETILLRLNLIQKYNGVDEVIITGIIDSLDNLIDLLKEEQ